MENQGIAETEEAQVAIQVSFIGSEVVSDRIKGFCEYWADNAPKSWTVLEEDIRENAGDSDRAAQNCRDFLAAYPNLKGIFSPDNTSTVGFAVGLTEAGRTDIVMVGSEFSEEIESMIRSGEYNVATMVQNPYVMGYNAVKTALSLTLGEAVPEKTVDTGVVPVDNQNIDAEGIRRITNL